LITCGGGAADDAHALVGGVGARSRSACGLRLRRRHRAGEPVRKPRPSPTQTEGDIGAAGVGDPPRPSTPGATAQITPREATSEPDPYLRLLSLTTADVRDLGLEVTPHPEPTSLTWPTLALCVVDLPGERRRSARYEVTIAPPGFGTGSTGVPGSGTRFSQRNLSSQVVRYSSAVVAREAMREWRTEIRDDRCRLSGLEIDDLRYTHLTETRDASLPIDDNSVVTLDVSLKGKGVVAHTYYIVQRRGDMVVTMGYVNGDAWRLADLKHLATTLGRRLLDDAR
jgi:hypothetical protein